MRRSLVLVLAAAASVLLAAACEDSSSSGGDFDAGAADGAFTPPDSSVLDAAVDVAVEPEDSAAPDAAPPAPVPPKTNLEVWLRADLGVTLTAGKVSAWADQSGKHHDFVQPDPVKQPTLAPADAGAGTALAFDGTTHLVADTTQLFPTSDAALAIAVVFTTSDPSMQRMLFNYGSGAADDLDHNLELGYATGDQSAGNFGLHRGNGNGTTTAPGLITAGAVYRAVVSVSAVGAAPGNVIVRSNGVAQASQNGGGGWFSAGSYVTQAAPMEIGGRVDGNHVAADYATHLAAAGDAHHVGTISEVLVYKGGLAPGDLANLETYLSTR